MKKTYRAKPEINRKLILSLDLKWTKPIYFRGTSKKSIVMIARIWHGYTTFGNADSYENLLNTKIFPYIAQKKVQGYRKIELLKRMHADEVEFITVMWFESLIDIRQFAGEDYEKAVVLPEADALLKRFDGTSQHYEIITSLSY